MVPSADVVVIGSGAFGASAAYHMARRGLRVAVLERAPRLPDLPRAAGLSSQLRATPTLTKLAQRAVAKLAAFTGETGQPLRPTQSGALKIARTERDAEQLAREVRRGSAAGVPIDFFRRRAYGSASDNWQITSRWRGPGGGRPPRRGAFMLTTLTLSSRRVTRPPRRGPFARNAG